MTFIEHEHPRDTGRFTDKEQSAPEAALTSASPDVQGTFVREAWQGDYAMTIDEETFPLAQILDSMDLDDVRDQADNPNDNDDLYYRASQAGILAEHNGPFTVRFDEDEITAYIDQRSAAGQEAAISRLPLGTKFRRAHVGIALRSAYASVSAPYIVTNESQATVAADFAEAARQLQASLAQSEVHLSDLDAADREAVDRFVAFVDGPGLRSDQWHAFAVHQSALLADWVINRDARLTYADQGR